MSNIFCSGVRTLDVPETIGAVSVATVVKPAAVVMAEIFAPLATTATFTEAGGGAAVVANDAVTSGADAVIDAELGTAAIVAVMSGAVICAVAASGEATLATTEAVLDATFVATVNEFGVDEIAAVTNGADAVIDAELGTVAAVAVKSGTVICTAVAASGEATLAAKEVVLDATFVATVNEFGVDAPVTNGSIDCSPAAETASACCEGAGDAMTTDDKAPLEPVSVAMTEDFIRIGDIKDEEHSEEQLGFCPSEPPGSASPTVNNVCNDPGFTIAML